jgi:hypothetical protein
MALPGIPSLNTSATATAVGTIGATTFGAVNIGASGGSAEAANTASLLQGGGTSSTSNLTLWLAIGGFALAVWYYVLRKK